MARATWGVHYQEVTWRRGARDPGEDDQYPGLSVEFDDDAEEDAGSKAVAEADALGGAVAPELISTRPASRWSRLPLRYRVTGAIAVLALVVGSVTAVRLDRAAQRRARERFTLAVVNDRYEPAISEVGLDMALTLVNNGPAPVTVEFLQVSQPGLSLAFYPVEVPLRVGTPTAFTLVGVFGCQGAATSGAGTVEVTVAGQSGTSSVVLGLKPGAVPPKGWQDQRSVFCAESNIGR
jgi:hypothetical protein